MGNRRLGIGVLAALCLGAAVVHVRYGGFASAFLAYSFGFVWVYGTGVRLGALREVRLTHRPASSELVCGGETLIEVRFRQRSLFPAAWIVIEDEWAHANGGRPIVYRKLLLPWFRRNHVYAYKLRPVRRGTYTLRRTCVHAGDCFGLIGKTVTIEEKMRKRGQGREQIQDRASVQGRELPRIHVYPKPLDARAGIGYAANGGLLSIRSGEHTHSSEVAGGVRDYAPGDPLNRIDWKSSARTGGLRSKQFDRLRSERMVICLDAGRNAASPRHDDLFETRVRVAAGLIGTYRISHDIAVACNDSALTFAHLGRGVRRHANEPFLASLVCDGSLSLPFFLRQSGVFLRGGQLICVTSALDDQLLSAVAGLQRGRCSVIVAHITPGRALPLKERRHAQSLIALGAGYVHVPVPAVPLDFPEEGGAVDADVCR